MGVAEKNAMKSGQAAPDFKDLPGVDGQKHSLADYASAKALVVFFSCNHCPYVQGYEDRLMQLQSDFKAKGVRFVAINSNDAVNYPDDSFDEMVKRAKNRRFNFDYLRDESQAVAKAYGATHTPQIFVFNSERKLSYTGKVDDNHQNPAAVKRQYLREVLSALTEGREPAEKETFAIGCTIKWKGPK